MNADEIKDGLEKFTKAELLRMFPSLEIKNSEKKAFIVELIIAGEPQEKEIENFKVELAERLEDDDSKVEYIVMSKIKEDGKVFEIGDPYTGKNVKKYFGEQIRQKDK